MATPRGVRQLLLSGMIALLGLSVATCRLDMLLKPSGPQKPVLAVTPREVHDSARAGSSQVRRTSVEIKNGSGDASFAWSASEDYRWIRLSHHDGTAPDTLTITLDPNDLAPGTYEGAVTVTSDADPERPVDINVTFEIQRPGLDVTPMSVEHATNVNSGATFSDNLSIDNTGTGTLTWTATKSKPWVTLGNTAGSGPGVVPVTINSAGLPGGIHTDQVVITSPGATGSPARVDVTLTIFAPGLAVTPAIVRDSAIVASIEPRTQTLHVTNSGTGAVTWTATKSQPWVTLSKSAGGAPDDVVVTLSPIGLPLGTQHDTIVFTSPEATNSPIRVPVAFAIQQPCPELPLVLDVPRAGTLAPPDCEAPHRPGSLANLYSFTASVGDTLSLRLTASFNAYLILTDSAGTVLAENDECLPETGTACIMAFPILATGRYFIEATSAGAGEQGPLTMLVVREQPPTPPEAIGQFRTSGDEIGIGATTPEDSVVIKGTINDPNRSDSVRLEIEIEPLGGPFSNVPTHQGQFVAVPGGSVAVAIRAGSLTDNSGYHWQARTCDRTGRCSAWLPFGGNAETDADFTVVVPPPPPPPGGGAGTAPGRREGLGGGK